MINAIKVAKDWLPGLDQQPEIVQKIVVDMSYNMGEGTLGDFVRLRAALLNHDYRKAADSMERSRWYTQTGDRAPSHRRVMLRLAEEQEKERKEP